MNKYVFLALVLISSLIAHSRADDDPLVNVTHPKVSNVPSIDVHVDDLIDRLKTDIDDYVKTITKKKMNKKEKTSLTNNFVDRVMAEFRVIADRDLDPLPLPDFDQGFDYTLLFVTVSSHMQLTEGKLHNLSTIQREGDVRIRNVGSRISVSIPLNLKKLPFTFHYSAKLVGIGPTGYIKGEAQRVHAVLKLTLDLKKKRFSKAQFKVTNRGLVTYDYEGYSLPDMVLYILKKVFGTFVDMLITILFKDYINQEFTGTIVNEINDVLDDVLHNIEK